MTIGALLVLTVAACTSPRDACIQSASKDLLVVRALIADSRATLKRGYAIHTQESLITYTVPCPRRDGKSGIAFCDRVEPVTNRKPVAVDLEAERRKLRSLEAKEAELRTRTDAQIAQCKSDHPEA